MKTFPSPQNHHPEKDEISSSEMRPRVQTAPGAHNARENSREPNEKENQEKIIRFEQEIGNIQRMLKSFGDQIRIFSPLGPFIFHKDSDSTAAPTFMVHWCTLLRRKSEH